MAMLAAEAQGLVGAELICLCLPIWHKSSGESSQQRLGNGSRTGSFQFTDPGLILNFQRPRGRLPNVQTAPTHRQLFQEINHKLVEFFCHF